MKIRRGQLWKNKATGRVVIVGHKATGNRHWNLDNGHHIHEGTLVKFYKPLTVEASGKVTPIQTKIIF